MIILNIATQVENSGDPWKAGSARDDNFTYFDSVWLTMVTMSTGLIDNSIILKYRVRYYRGGI